MTEPPPNDIRDLISRMADELDHYRQLLSDDRREVHPLATAARAALAAEPVGEGPSEEELDLLVIAIQTLAPHQPDATTHNLASVDRGREILSEALARWSRPAAPPAPAPELGEVGELVAMLRREAHWKRVEATAPIFTEHADRIDRAATLLSQQAAPAPVVVSGEVHFEFAVVDGDCIQQAGGTAPTYSQALSEGRHYLAEYLQDGLHTLEIRRIEQMPQVGEGEG